MKAETSPTHPETKGRDLIPGELAWFLKSMATVRVVGKNKDGTYTVERVEAGKTMIALRDGLKRYKSLDAAQRRGK